MSAARVAGLWAVTFLLAAPAYAATVAVAPIRDAGKRGEGEAIEKQIEKGLASGHLSVITPSRLAAGAKKQGLPASDIDKRPVLMPVARQLGADAVFTANIVERGKQLQIRVFNLDGVELWSRKIPLKNGKLAPDIPGKIARAVNAAIANAPSSQAPAQTPAETPEQPDQQAEQPAETPSQPEQQAEQPAQAEQPKTKPQQQASEDETPIVTPKKKKPAKQQQAAEALPTDEGDTTIEGPPKEAKVDTTPMPPIIDVGVGFAIISRSYRLCPGVTSCSASPPPQTGNLDIPVNYQTSSPAGGFLLRLELFPLPKMVQISDNLVFTLGLSAEYLRSLGVTNSFQNGDVATTFSSNSSRLSAGLEGRLYFHALDGTGYVGLNGGALLPAFNVDVAAQGDTPVLYPSQRKGFDVGLRAQVPLAANYVKVMAQAQLAPSANPGVTETTAYGQTGTGKGLLFRGGLEGEYSYVGYGAYADYAQFSDVFAGPGDRTSNGAVSEEKYLSFFLMVRGHY